MKGLLLKDFYQLTKYCRAYLAVALVFAAAAAVNNNMFFLVYPMIMVSVIPINLISYDEKSKWNLYAGALPYSRRQLVSVKYVIALVVFCAAFLLLAAAQTFAMYRSGNVDWQSWSMAMAAMTLLGMISPCIILPIVFRFGVEKGRVMYYIAVFAICGSIGVIGEVGLDLTEIQSFIQSWFVPAALGVSAVLFLVSWLVSIFLYQNRELS